MVDCTVQKYFFDAHKITLQYPDLPCLHVGSKNKNVFLPMEVKTYVSHESNNFASKHSSV